MVLASEIDRRFCSISSAPFPFQKRFIRNPLRVAASRMSSADLEISERMWRAISRGAEWARSSVTSPGPAARPSLNSASCSSSS
eukprot:1187583-Pyramimonas_sp.AAC.1